jgi:hypothetical protein
MVIPDGFMHCSEHNVYFIPKSGHTGCGECRKMEKIADLWEKNRKLTNKINRVKRGAAKKVGELRQQLKDSVPIFRTASVGLDLDGDGKVDVVVKGSD